MDYEAVFSEPAADGRRHLVQFAGDHCDPALLLDFSEEEFVIAVHGMR